MESQIRVVEDTLARNTSLLEAARSKVSELEGFVTSQTQRRARLQAELYNVISQEAEEIAKPSGSGCGESHSVEELERLLVATQQRLLAARAEAKSVASDVKLPPVVTNDVATPVPQCHELSPRSGASKGGACAVQKHAQVVPERRTRSASPNRAQPARWDFARRY